MTSPLVAQAQSSTTWYTGLGLVEDAAEVTHGIENNSWVDGTLGGVGGSLDLLSVAVDPLGTLASWGVAWLMEHVKPLKDALDWLAGNPDEIAAHAATWSNVAKHTEVARQDHANAVGAQTSEWLGSSGEAYRRHAEQHLSVMQGIATAAHGISCAVQGAGLLVGLVRGIVRDLIAQFIGTLAARLPQWLAEAGVTLGVATPVVIGQVSALVATWVNKIQKFIRALLNSLRRLRPMLDRLGKILTELRSLATRLSRSDPLRWPGAPATPVTGAGGRAGVFPSGSDFIPDADGFSPRAAEAYTRIRNSPDDTPRIVDNTGLDPKVIEGMRQNLFVQQHDVPLGPNQVVRGYFTPHTRISDLWDDAANGSLSPARMAEFRSLAAHEYVEYRLMEAGLPYRSAHPDAFDEFGDPDFNPAHPGAHDLAPNEWRPTAPLAHWRAFGIDHTGLDLADDLSNLDTIVEAALRGLGR